MKYSKQKLGQKIRNKKGSNAQSKQLLTINKQVAKLTRAVKDQTIWKQFYMENTYPQPDLNNAPVLLPYKFYTIPLVRPDDWQSCFQSRIDTETPANRRQLNYYGQKFMGKSMDLQMRFQIEDTGLTLSPCVVTYWIVSLREEGGTNTIQDTRGLQALQNGTGVFNDGTQMNKRYWIDSEIDTGTQPSGLVMLNKDAFKIHAYKKFYIANQLNNSLVEDAQPTTSLKSIQRNFRHKMSYLNHIKAPAATQPGLLTQPIFQGWKGMEVEEVEPKDRRYLIVHTNYLEPLSSTETSVSLSYNVLFNGRIIQGG